MQLRGHIDGLFQREGAFHGKGLGDCHERAARYKLSAIKNRAQLALAVSKQIGVEVESLVLKDSSTEVRTQVSLSSNAAATGFHPATAVYCSRSVDAQKSVPETPLLDAALQNRSEPSGRNHNFTNLQQAEKATVYRILQVLDRFCVSDAAYHETTMALPDFNLPKSYIVKQSRADLNEILTVEVLNSDTKNLSGARISFYESLRAELRLFQKPNKDEEARKK